MKELISAIQECESRLKEVRAMPKCEVRDNTISLLESRLNALKVHLMVAY